jgi:hypothetical protein
MPLLHLCTVRVGEFSGPEGVNDAGKWCTWGELIEVSLQLNHINFLQWFDVRFVSYSRTLSTVTDLNTTQQVASKFLYLCSSYRCVTSEFYSHLGTVRPIYRTGTPLPSKHPMLYIFSTNRYTDFVKHAARSLFFFLSLSLQNAVYFITLPFFGSYIICILHTGCAKI